MTHADAVRATLLALSDLGCMAAQRHVGLFYDVQGRPRMMGIPGEADVQGIAPDGRAIAVEIKTGQASRRLNQKRWANRFQQLGGLYIVARFSDSEDGAQQIREAFRKEGLG